MNKCSLLIIFALLISCLFHEAHAASIEKVRLIWHKDPAHHAVIAWCGLKAEVTYSLKNSNQPKTASATRTTFAKNLAHQFVHLHNLKPDTAYEITLKHGILRKTYWFKTAPNKPQSFTFVAGGDSRNHRDARQRANRMVAKLRPLFVAFGGDMTDSDTDDAWNKWLDDWELTTTKDGKLTPIIVARGNHERRNKDIQNIFNIPQKNIYYVTAIGGENFLRFYTLNSEIMVDGNQKNWLERDLKENPIVHWRMAQYHKPIRPHVSYKREGTQQYHAWAPLFYQYQFKLIFESDSHTVKRTWPIRPSTEPGSFEGFIRDDKQGTVFVGEGCWGAPLRAADDKKTWTRASGSFNQFKWVHVHLDRIELRTIIFNNVDEVSSVDDAHVFKPPKGLKTWKPGSGEVLIIPAHSESTKQEQDSN